MRITIGLTTEVQNDRLIVDIIFVKLYPRDTCFHNGLTISISVEDFIDILKFVQYIIISCIVSKIIIGTYNRQSRGLHNFIII